MRCAEQRSVEPLRSGREGEETTGSENCGLYTRNPAVLEKDARIAEQEGDQIQTLGNLPAGESGTDRVAPRDPCCGIGC